MSSFVRFLGRRARSLVRPETQSETTAADASSLTTLRLLAIPYARTVPRTNASSHKPHHNEQLASLRMNHPPSPPTPQIIHYLLYPATMPKPNASVPRRAVEEVLGLWKNGLWVIGRAYRAVWNFTFLPQIYRDGTNAQTAIVNNHVLSGSERDSPERQSLLERTRKRIFDASDRAVLPWVSSGEEELLRQLNTHGQFVHFGHNAHVPIKRVL